MVFIDDKAKDFYSGTPFDAQIPEEKLSVELFKNFKNNGKSLTVHKFEASNLQEPEILDYLFNSRDLILLDWELSNASGQEYSLRLLHKAISTPYINFCCIYSSANNFNEIPIFLNAYFSGISKTEFITIQETYSYITSEEIVKVWDKSEEVINVFFEENGIDKNNFPLERIRDKKEFLLLRYIYISLNVERFIIPESANEHEVLKTGDDSFIINNTFVLTLKKEHDTDSDYENLLQRISNVVINNKGSFFQLLGLEMQSLFNSNERFIDETILKSSTEALFQFRNHLNDDKTFATIIKKLLIEQATLKLRTAKLELLDADFLKLKSAEINGQESTVDDLLQLNVFYNSVTVKSLHPESIPNLNFGDIFKDSDDIYYLCITALCDCYYPNKIDSNFYFVKGYEFDDLEMALKLGDTAFLSFMPSTKVIQWGETEFIKKEKIKRQDGETEDQHTIRVKEAELKAYKSFLHKPYYIKPKVYNVENNKLIDNKIRFWDITNRHTKDNFDQKLNYIEAEYITTLRTDYTQRIANHAFGHPTRVGVDFVKI